ncbi:hypothetical protein [Nocardioides sp.]|uniref:hypothetical protein n=1 Tax=Nocardioides sp. TaxID=35761 RepID=UPI0035B346D1
MNLTYDQIQALCVGVVLGAALTALLIVLQAGLARPKRQRLELGSNHDRLDAEAASYIARPRSSSNRKPGRF